MGIYCANQEVIHYFMYKSTDYFLNKLQTEQGRDRYDHPIVWCDNSPAFLSKTLYLLCGLPGHKRRLPTNRLKIFVGG